MIDLRPCPFCGNNVRLEDREFDDFAGNFFTNTMLVIECEKCGISMKRYPKRGYGTTDEQKKDLINSWNRRTEVNSEEQEAVEPDVDSEGTCTCGNCGENVGWYPVGSKEPVRLCKFCSECGHEVKWND